MMEDSDMFRSSPDRLRGVYNKQEMLHVRVPEVDVNKIECLWIVCESVHFDILHLLVLSVELFITSQI